MLWIISLHMQWANAQGRSIRLVEGDITRVPVDAIANAANASLAGGGGVDGAIHRAGGPSIMRELDTIRAKSGGCPTGSAVATSAGNLPARWVLHAVGPVYRDGTRGEAELLASAYRTCLELASERGARSISFPAISTGIYGYPIEEAARIAIDTACAYLDGPGSVEEVVFVLFGKSAYDVFSRVLRGLP
jgi:O-acetyl-ADP-ribose deacetylase (regulator of RNase III)